MSRNLVTKIEKFVFKGLYLVAINLSQNMISVIERGAFENCANITNLDLSHNAIANFEKDAFDEITYATEFHLEFNNITDLSQVICNFMNVYSHEKRGHFVGISLGATVSLKKKIIFLNW